MLDRIKLFVAKLLVQEVYVVQEYDTDYDEYFVYSVHFSKEDAERDMGKIKSGAHCLAVKPK